MSTVLTMNPAVHRKPLPGRAPPPAHAAYNVPPQEQLPSQASPQQQAQYYQRSRGDTQSTMATTSTGVPDHRASSMYSIAPSAAPTQQMQYGQQPSRRTLSNATSSTSSSATNTALQRAPTNASNGPRRSTSSRSNSSVSPTSYVALMRKQKATVWCDRAQAEDPRILAAQRAAKMRAAMEVAGGSHRVSTSSSQQQGSVGIRSKIRHHGAPKAAAYTGTYISSGGVPMRLSASEVDDGNDSDEEDSRYMNYHKRNSSGRSSMGSRNNSYLHAGPTGLSNGSRPPSGNGQSPIPRISDDKTPGPNSVGGVDYFGQAGGHSAGTPGSEDEKKFGGLGGLPERELTAEEQMKRDADLRRRGSVDDRTMTMSAGRLFVANPDLSD